MTLTRKVSERVKAEEKGKEEEARINIRIKIRTRTIITEQRALPLLPVEPDATPDPQEEQGIVMSGVRGVLIRNPDPHLQGDLAHRKVRPQVVLLLLQSVRSLKKSSVREVFEEKVHQEKIRQPLATSFLRVNVKTETNVNFGIQTCAETLPQDVLV